MTWIDVDREALQAAMRLSGARTREQTVERALREYTARRRREALEHYAALAKHWDYEGWVRRRDAEQRTGS